MVTSEARSAAASRQTRIPHNSEYSKIDKGLTEALDHARGDNGAGVEHTVVVDKLDVREVRESLRLTQEEFALRFGFNLGTLCGWEQGRRQPDVTARVLLEGIQNAPDAVEKALLA